MKIPAVRLSLIITAFALLLGCQSDPELVDIGVLPEFSFLDQNKQPIGTAQLKGKPWIVSFAFTSCPTSCPPLMEAQSKLQAEVKKWAGDGEPPVQLITITVDPVTDTPERLKTYSARYNVDDRFWRFARGTYPEMATLVTEGFMMPLMRKDFVPGKFDENMAKPTPLDTAHSLRFVLVDGDMHIRGLYERDDEDIERMSDALRFLARSSK